MTRVAAVKRARFRFYEELNDFLPPRLRKRDFDYAFSGHPAVKDAIEALGVPHVEVDLVLVGGRSVGFEHPLDDGARVAVYPVFESLDIAPVQHLRPAPLREPRFSCDVHLGKLARLLRLLGFDALCAETKDDAAFVARALAEQRLVLTRSRGLLKRRELTRGLWIRAADPIEQAREIVGRLDLAGRASPCSRCLVCNGRIEAVAKEEIAGRLPARTRREHEEFSRCAACGKLYWRGSHHARLESLIRELLSS